MSMTERYETWMREALSLARTAMELGEVPVGAVVVMNDQIVGRGHNRRKLDEDPLAHAEVVALRQAASSLGNWRFDEATLVVTLEPCVMCAGAIVQSRVKQVVYGASDRKAGAVRSLYQVLDDPRMYHRAAVVVGVLQDECAALLSDFFRATRRC
jgi:tRNA(adenine34) deaminase